MLRRRSLYCHITLFPFLSSATTTSLFSSSSSSCKRSTLSLPYPEPPPLPKRIPFTVSAHGRSWEDPYHWMSNTSDPDLVDYLNRENSYADAFMEDTQDLQQKLVSEMRSRMPAKISTPPERWGPWLYYQYIPEGKEYPVLCRRLGSHSSFVKVFLNYMRSFIKEEILLDWNEIAEKFGYVHIGTCRVSPNHRFLAYTIDTSGGELFVLQVKDLKTGSIIPNLKLEGIVGLAWAGDSGSLLYTVCDETQRPCRVLCAKLGSDVVDDLVFTENDVSFCVDITSTKDGKFITINSNSRSTSEIHVMDATNMKDGLWQVRKRVPGVQYFLEHHHGFFYLLTNSTSESTGSNSGDYHLCRCRAGNFPLDNWQDILVSSQDVTFQDMDLFDGHLVLFLRNGEIPMLCSIDMSIDLNFEQPRNVEDLNPWFFPIPSNLCSIVPGSNHDFMTSIYRVVISSLVMPDIIVDYDMSKRKFAIVHQEEVLGLTRNTEADSFADNAYYYPSIMQFNNDEHIHSIEDLQDWSDISASLSCERKEVMSRDGVSIPLTILYSQKAPRTGQSPGLLYGYGAYGEVLDKSWCADRLSLLDRGWFIAYADVRGGGGGQTSWHEAGIGLRKGNSVYDFIACGMYLINEGFVHKKRLCAVVCSAGGLLVGAAINMYPDLFCGAILKVPFLDICNTMLDPSLPLTRLDYEEFGDPRIEMQFKAMHSYSPYDNIPSGLCHPSMLITASFNDSRVGVWEAAKWVARMRENSCPTCSRPIILRTNMSGGHFPEGGRFKHCEDTAFEYAFLMKVMEMLDNSQPQGV